MQSLGAGDVRRPSPRYFHAGHGWAGGPCTDMQSGQFSEHPHPYSIAVTANAMKHQDDLYFTNGFSPILPKPYKKSELAQA